MMQEKEQTEQEVCSNNPKRKMPDIAAFLKQLNGARIQVGLYGVEHPSSSGIIKDLLEPVKELCKALGKVTFIFTKKDVLVNDHHFTIRESADFFKRLRSRGVMAFTFVGTPPEDQLKEFLLFLSAEPREIKDGGGPCEYLRSHDVTRIVVTPAIYTLGEDPDAAIEVECVEWDPENVDYAISLAINWLSKQEHSDDLHPRLPITEILSHPYMAGKLIREAVSKLHVSARSNSSEELASRAFMDLKSLADDPEKWDQAMPQIRRAICKLPKELRPVGGLLGKARQDDSPDKKLVDICDIEEMVADALESGCQTPLDQPKLGIEELRRLFDVKATGLPSGWCKELQPTNCVRSSGTTLGTLMIWETSPTEHSREANALAALIPKALEMEDKKLALYFAEQLAKEAAREDGLAWRTINARSALGKLDRQMLITLAEEALRVGDYYSKAVGALMVEAVPELAVSMVDVLGKYRDEPFDVSLKRGLVRAGRDAVCAVGRVLRDGSPAARESALEALVEMGISEAVQELATIFKCKDSAFAVKVLTLLPSIRAPFVTDACLSALSHKSGEVRCAAVSALGEIGDVFALPALRRVAAASVWRGERIPEKLTAIRALGNMGGSEDLPFLQRLATGRSIIWGTRYMDVRTSATQAAHMIHSRQAVRTSKAA